MENLGERLPSMEDVKNAVVLLQSIGVQNLCLDHNNIYNNDWNPYLPACSSHPTTEMDMDIGYSPYLRGTTSTTPTIIQQSHRRLFEPNRHFDSVEEKEAFFFYNIGMVVVCVCCCSLIAGLFLGLLTLDVLDLRIIERASIDEEEKLYARTILPIIENRHELLVTLLLLNALAYETMPIFLDAIVPSWAAIILSTTLVMFFGEILPSGTYVLYLFVCFVCKSYFCFGNFVWMKMFCDCGLLDNIYEISRHGID